MGNIAGSRSASAVFSGINTCNAYESLAKDTRNDLCLRVVCELFSI